jgi:hypothetical protein
MPSLREGKTGEGHPILRAGRGERGQKRLVERLLIVRGLQVVQVRSHEDEASVWACERDFMPGRDQGIDPLSSLQEPPDEEHQLLIRTEAQSSLDLRPLRWTERSKALQIEAVRDDLYPSADAERSKLVPHDAGAHDDAV